MEFGNLKTEGQVEKLKQLLKPMMLRRLKEDVEKNIAPKEETIIEVCLYCCLHEYPFPSLHMGESLASFWKEVLF